MNAVLIKTLKILYCIFCMICTSVVTFHTLIILTHSIFTGFDFQIFLFTLFSLTLVAGFWSLLFVKISFKCKIVIFILLFFTQLNYIQLSALLPSISRIIDMNLCLDNGLCKEDIEINTKDGLVKINKLNCLKYDWQWDEKYNRCKIINH